MSNHLTTIGWRAPSNIALIKYWGKKALQIPINGSLSISLDKCCTTTFLSFSKKELADKEIDLQYFFQNERHPKFETKVTGLLNSILPEMSWLATYQLIFHSENNFPHSTGIASSASSMAALALCLVSLEESEKGKYPDVAAFYRRASYLARLGSGSASRSVYGGLVSWGSTPEITGSTDQHATPFQLSEESRFNSIMDAILIVSTKEKAVSSSAGHSMMADHPYREGRIIQANNNLRSITKAIREENYSLTGEIAENEALSLHALLISSLAGGVLLHPNTLQILEEIRQFRASTDVELFFTIDAGPNVHLIYFEDDREKILPFIRQKLVQYCENGEWIDDKMGNGPTFINPKIEI